jgi:hypothetical protein
MDMKLPVKKVELTRTFHVTAKFLVALRLFRVGLRQGIAAVSANQ